MLFFRIVPQNNAGLVETLGKYKSRKEAGLHLADCKIKPNTLHKKTAETLMVID